MEEGVEINGDRKKDVFSKSKLELSKKKRNRVGYIMRDKTENVESY